MEEREESTPAPGDQPKLRSLTAGAASDAATVFLMSGARSAGFVTGKAAGEAAVKKMKDVLQSKKEGAGTRD